MNIFLVCVQLMGHEQRFLGFLGIAHGTLWTRPLTRIKSHLYGSTSVGICGSQERRLSQWFYLALDISLGSSHIATYCKNLENCFHLHPGACFNDDPIAFVWFCYVFLRNGKWSTLTFLFWWPINFFFSDVCPLSNMYCPNSRFYNSRRK